MTTTRIQAAHDVERPPARLNGEPEEIGPLILPAIMRLAGPSLPRLTDAERRDFFTRLEGIAR